MNRLSLPSIIMAGITFYVGLYHLLIWVRQRRYREHLNFGLVCLCVVFYDLSSAGLYSATSAVGGVEWQRAQFVALATIGLAYLWFIVGYISLKPGRAVYVFSAYFILAAIIELVDRSALTWLMDQPSVKSFFLFGIDITYYEMTPGPLTSIQSLMGLVTFAYILWHSLRFYRAGNKKDARPLLLAMVLFLVGLVNDTAVYSGALQSIYLTEYAYMGMVLLMTDSLTSDVVQAAATKEALEKSEERYRNLVEFAPIPIFVHHAGRFVYLNSAAVELHGAKNADELVGKSLIDFVHPDYRTILRERIRQGIEGQEQTRRSEIKIVRLDDQVVDVEVTAMPVSYLGRIAQLAICLDVTERKQAEFQRDITSRALQDSEATYRALLEAIPDTIFRIDSNGVFIDCIPAEGFETPIPASEFMGKSLHDVLPPGPAQQIQHSTAQALKTGKTQFVEHPLTGPEGTRVYEVRTAPIDQNEVLAMVRDITARRQGEIEREKLLHALGHRSNLLQTAAEISRSASSLLDPEELVNEVVNLIQERFDLYYVGLFLVDQDSEYAVLYAGTGPAGRQLLAEGHQLAVGGESMVGQCVAQGEARIALDLDQEAMRFDNPALPKTRSEMALPLISHGKCIGAITIQSTLESAFTQEDIAILQSIADQMAIAIENARLFQQRDIQVETLRHLNSVITRLQHLLQNITDSMPSALITLDPDGRVLTGNPAAETLMGQTASEIQGKSLWQTCPELTRYQDLVNRVLGDGQLAERPREELESEAGVIYRDVSVFPLGANDIEGAVLRIDDVTHRVHLEEMMLQSAKMASIGGLAAGVAHEINNPLGAMMQSAQMLQIILDTQRPRTREHLQQCGVDPEKLNSYLQERALMDYLDGIREAGQRAAKIVSDLLSFSRKASSNIAPHDLNALVEKTLELAAIDFDLKKRYDFRNIELVRHLDPDLPQVACDGQQIQQVILNLVRNATQAMAESKMHEADSQWHPRLTLRTTMVPGDSPALSFLRLELEDNGPGIPKATQARLFEPFFTTKKIGEGTGLGLWLSWSIVVERHNGRIWAEPGSEGGSRFVVELPIA